MVSTIMRAARGKTLETVIDDAMKQGRQRLAGGYALHEMETVTAAIEAYRIGGILSKKEGRRKVDAVPYVSQMGQHSVVSRRFAHGIESSFLAFLCCRGRRSLFVKKNCAFWDESVIWRQSIFGTAWPERTHDAAAGLLGSITQGSTYQKKNKKWHHPPFRTAAFSG
jgi:hypothetical protein